MLCMAVLNHRLRFVMGARLRATFVPLTFTQRFSGDGVVGVCKLFQDRGHLHPVMTWLLLAITAAAAAAKMCYCFA
jgi:hypothetical protein